MRVQRAGAIGAGMKRLLIAAALMLAAPGAHASLAEVAAHLKATRTLTAAFTQTGANGVVEHGALTLSRPGRLRFQYDNAQKLIVADGRRVNLIDYKVAQLSSWPIKGPLAVLLEDDRDLSGYARVVSEDPRAIEVEAAVPKHPEYGTTTIRFARDSAGPAGLRIAGWQVRDAQGNLTKVELSQLRFNSSVDSALFRFRDPRPRRIPGKG